MDRQTQRERNRNSHAHIYELKLFSSLSRLHVCTLQAIARHVRERAAEQNALPSFLHTTGQRCTAKCSTQSVSNEKHRDITVCTRGTSFYNKENSYWTSKLHHTTPSTCMPPPQCTLLTGKLFGFSNSLNTHHVLYVVSCFLPCASTFWCTVTSISIDLWTRKPCQHCHSHDEYFMPSFVHIPALRAEIIASDELNGHRTTYVQRTYAGRTDYRTDDPITWCSTSTVIDGAGKHKINRL